ncbi:MAG: hypothetical protein HYX68_02885 [Planctomycetes bacterium]|nr:hypothetical protein [Planctomycetota bacterium]
MGLAVIVIGFALMTLGVALLFLGEVPFILGRRLPALRSRLIGGVFIGYLPLAVGTHLAISAWLGEDAVGRDVTLWSILGVCLFASFVLVYRVLFPKKAPRPAQAPPLPGMPGEDAPANLDAVMPFDEPAPPEPTASKTREKKNNPFDFS